MAVMLLVFNNRFLKFVPPTWSPCLILLILSGMVAIMYYISLIQSAKEIEPSPIKRSLSFEMVSIADADLRSADESKKDERKNRDGKKKKKGKREENKRARSKDDLDLRTLSADDIVVNIPRKKKDMESLITLQAIEIRGYKDIIDEGKRQFVKMMDENEDCLRRIEEKDQIIAEKDTIIQTYSQKNINLKSEIEGLKINLSEKDNLLLDSRTETQNLKIQIQDQEQVVKEMQIALEKSDIEAKGLTPEANSNGVLNGVEEGFEASALRRENERLRSQLKDRESLIEEGRTVLSNLNRDKEQLQRQLRESERACMDKQFALDKFNREKERDKIQLRQKEMEASAKGKALEKIESDFRKAREELKRKQTALAEVERALERTERLKQQAIEERRSNEQRFENERQNLQESIAHLREEKRACEDRLRRVEASQQVQERTLQNLEADRNRAKQSADILRKDQPWMITKDDIILTDKILGTGAWGKVFEGNFRGMKVAVKELHEVIKSAHNKLLFDREITFATLVRHPCILQFLGVADYRSNSPLLVTELMDMSLSHLLAQQKGLGQRHVTTLAQDIAYGLNYLHCFRPRPIIHRDVNPGNVMIWHQGDVWRAKLCDFGSADFVSVNMSVNPGNPFYSAPEVNSPKQTVKVDVYSYGVLLCELSTSQAPNPQDRTRQIVLVRNQDLKKVIERCVHENPVNRPTMGEVIEIQRPLIT